MDLILDTCAFIWWDSGGGQLGSAAEAALRDSANRLYLSHASIWEMQLKHQRGKLTLRSPLQTLVEDQCFRNGLILLPIETAHLYGLNALPYHHNDPFDRLIISQTKIHGFQIVTDDPEFKKYGVSVLW